MSEVYKIYGLGSTFPFGGGMATLDLIITFTDFDRLVVNPIYNNSFLKENTKIKSFIPGDPGNEIQILQDALLLFAPSVFKQIPSYSKLTKITNEKEHIELSDRNTIWDEIRKDSASVFKKLNLFELLPKKINFN